MILGIYIQGDSFAGILKIPQYENRKDAFGRVVEWVDNILKQ